VVWAREESAQRLPVRCRSHRRAIMSACRQIDGDDENRQIGYKILEKEQTWLVSETSFNLPARAAAMPVSTCGPARSAMRTNPVRRTRRGTVAGWWPNGWSVSDAKGSYI